MNILWTILIGAGFFFLMKKMHGAGGGCCGGHNSSKISPDKHNHRDNSASSEE